MGMRRGPIAAMYWLLEVSRGPPDRAVADRRRIVSSSDSEDGVRGNAPPPLPAGGVRSRGNSVRRFVSGPRGVVPVVGPIAPLDEGYDDFPPSHPCFLGPQVLFWTLETMDGVGPRGLRVPP